jgi:hypothetical protein
LTETGRSWPSCKVKERAKRKKKKKEKKKIKEGVEEEENGLDMKRHL